MRVSSSAGLEVQHEEPNNGCVRAVSLDVLSEIDEIIGGQEEIIAIITSCVHKDTIKFEDLPDGGDGLCRALKILNKRLDTISTEIFSKGPLSYNELTMKATQLQDLKDQAEDLKHAIQGAQEELQEAYEKQERERSRLTSGAAA